MGALTTTTRPARDTARADESFPLLPTRVHGAVDWSVAASFGVVALGSPLGWRARAVLGSAGAYHAAYSALTDYEAGVASLIGMRGHLALDAVGALGISLASLVGEGLSRQERRLLLAVGLTEFAIIGMSSAKPTSGPGQVAGHLSRVLGVQRSNERYAYPPCNVPKAIADDVWIVDAEPMRRMGMPMPVRMTVIRLGGDLLLHSPTRYSEGLRARLASLGRVRWLVAPNVAHWTFLREWQQTCPQAETWAAPALTRRGQVRRSGLRFDRVLTDPHPQAWREALDIVRVPGGLGFEEFAFFHRATRTLVLTDLVVNLEPEKVPELYRPVLRALGMMEPDGRAPAYVRAIVRLRRKRAAQAAARLFALRPERVVFAHGRWFDRDALPSLRRSLRWLER